MALIAIRDLMVGRTFYERLMDSRLTMAAEIALILGVDIVDVQYGIMFNNKIIYNKSNTS